MISNYYREKKLFLFQKNTPKTEAEKKKVLKSLNQVVERAWVVHTIIGKDDMHTIEREDVIMALEQLLLFPKDPIASKNKKYFEGIDKTEWIDINSHVNHEVILPTTAIIYLEDTGKIYNWLKEHGKASYNPFQKLAKAKHINIQEEKDKKQPFSKSDLKQIFNHKVFTELKLGVNPITRVILDYQYWMPLTSYLSGMRPNEAAQMKCKHVVNVDDIWCFEVTNTGEQESVKNVSSKRLVPIHSKLLELGILSLIESREPEELLFKDLTYSSEGYFRKVSDWFKRTFAIPMSLSKESKSYYSFRHNFMDPFVQSGNNGYLFKRLVGHTGDGVAERSYGKEADVKLLKELVESFDFGDVLDNVKPFSVGTAA
ncbi:site-specific integrase [Vibrio brasiliensis]|uniref:site-specific integrase n=1 Tax=Vibrio brasiliensis TaxID=170652 RepID=UPI001EFE2CF7|nr:site-specific integrase [Vibrio brasiliensis]MCG9725711.1 site-specific integrase [Vibrio brasiliensis]